MWPDEVDDVLGGDLTCAIAYVTPAGGAVVTAVAPIGLRDREANTVGFTTSLGFGRKLDRLRTEPRIAMAYHAREHGLGDGANRRYVLVQGRASFDADPDPRLPRERDRPALGPLPGRTAPRVLLGPLAAGLLRGPRAGDRRRGAHRGLARPADRGRPAGGRERTAGRAASAPAGAQEGHGPARGRRPCGHAGGASCTTASSPTWTPTGTR